MALIRMALAIVDMKAYTGMARGHGCLILRFVNLHISKFEAFVPSLAEVQSSQDDEDVNG